MGAPCSVRASELNRMALGTRKKKVMVLSLGKGIAQCVGIAVGMAMARILVKDDVAAYRQTMLAYMSVAPILGMGIGQGIYYFLPSEELRIRGRVLDAITALGIIGLVLAIFLAVGGNQLLARRFTNPQVAGLLLWMIPYAILSTPATITESVLVARDRANWAAIFGLGRQMVVGAATIIPLVLWEIVEAPLIGNVTASIMMAVVAFRLMMKSVPPDSHRPSVSGIAELVKFAVPISLAGMIGKLSMILDKIIVSMMCPPDEFAVYSFGALEIPVIGIVTGSLTAVLLADMRKYVATGNKREALRLFRVAAEKSMLVIIPAMAFFLITADSLMVLMYTEEYRGSATPFRWYLVLLPIRTAVFSSILIALGRSRFLLTRSIVALSINVVLSILFVNVFGPTGAVMATVAVMYIWIVPISIWVMSKELEQPWYRILPLEKYVEVVFFLIPIVLLSTFLYQSQNLFLKLGGPVLVFGAFCFWIWKTKLFAKSSDA